MDDDDLPLHLPALDGDDGDPETPDDAALLDDIEDEDEEVGLDASTLSDADPGAFDDLLDAESDETYADPHDESGLETDSLALLDDEDAEPPPFGTDGDDGAWEDHTGLEEAPPLGTDDGGRLGLEDLSLDGEEDDEVDLPGLDEDRDDDESLDGAFEDSLGQEL